MSRFTFAISCLTTFNLPWFMDLTFQVPMQYCCLQRRTLLLSPVTSTTGCCFCFGSIISFFLELFLHWSPIAYWAPTDLGSSSFSILSFCLFILFMGFSRQESEVVCHSLLQWPTFCQTSPPWPVRLEWPHTAWLSFTELDTTVVLWSDWLVFCDYGFSVSALWCPLATPTVLLGFLLPWMWGMSSRLLQQSAAAAPYLGRGVSSHGCPSWPWTWSSSSWPSCARTATVPWTWGCSSQLPPLTLDVGWLISATFPDQWSCMGVRVGLWRKLSAKELMLLNCGVGETLESPLDCKEIQPVHPKGDQFWVFIARTDAEAETPILWPPHAKSWLIWKDPDAWSGWGQEEKGMTEDEMVGCHHQLDGPEFG